MSAPKLAEIGSIIVKKAPSGLSNRAFYLARPSFPAGMTPAHLVAYREKFTAAAPRCAASLRGMPKGPEHVRAMRGCMKEQLGK
jgi:hypothetical protein